MISQVIFIFNNRHFEKQWKTYVFRSSINNSFIELAGFGSFLEVPSIKGEIIKWRMNDNENDSWSCIHIFPLLAYLVQKEYKVIFLMILSKEQF